MAGEEGVEEAAWMRKRMRGGDVGFLGQLEQLVQGQYLVIWGPIQDWAADRASPAPRRVDHAFSFPLLRPEARVRKGALNRQIERPHG